MDTWKCSHDDYDVEWFNKNVELAMHKVHTQYTTATGGCISFTNRTEVSAISLTKSTSYNEHHLTAQGVDVDRHNRETKGARFCIMQRFTRNTGLSWYAM